MKFNVLKKIGLSHLLVIFLTLSGSIAAFEVEGCLLYTSDAADE